MSDTYRTIKGFVEGQLTEKRSKFLAFVSHIDTEEEAKAAVASYKKKYYDARHVCYAYIVGADGSTTRQNDDGEPSGTAGRPILNQLQSRELTFVLAVVVRYFGGVKLGTGPLAVAYKTAVADTLEEAEVEECIVKSEIRVHVPYADSDVAMRFIREGGGEVTHRDYDADGCSLAVSVRMDDEETLRARLSKILSLRFTDDEEQ